MTDSQDEEQPVDVAECGSCADFTEHEVLRRSAKGAGEDLLVQCKDCGGVQTLHLRPGKAVGITTILSDGAESHTDKVEADEDELIGIGEVFEHAEILYRITRLDDEKSRPQNSMVAGEISTMWAVRCDKAIVRLTMTDGEESTSRTIECTPDEIFSCGSIMEIDGVRWRIRALHTGKGRTLRGKRAAIDIRRIYLHLPYARSGGDERRDSRGPRRDEWAERNDHRHDARRR